MAERRRIVVNEWVFVVQAPKPGYRGPVTVGVQNAEPKDRPMAKALAEVVRLWINAARRRG
jgi:ABC-type phosphonate transport system ATPase subunit